jgi:hypothetical protein
MILFLFYNYEYFGYAFLVMKMAYGIARRFYGVAICLNNTSLRGGTTWQSVYT